MLASLGSDFDLQRSMKPQDLMARQCPLTTFKAAIGVCRYATLTVADCLQAGNNPEHLVHQQQRALASSGRQPAQDSLMKPGAAVRSRSGLLPAIYTCR